MKYGYNDEAWMDGLRRDFLWRGTAFTEEVANFNEVFRGVMKRKTVKEIDKKALEVLKEMTVMIEQHINEIEKK